MPEYTFFFKQYRLAFGLWGWGLFLPLVLCMDSFVGKLSRLLTMKFIQEVYIGME